MFQKSGRYRQLLGQIQAASPSTRRVLEMARIAKLEPPFYLQSWGSLLRFPESIGQSYLFSSPPELERSTLSARSSAESVGIVGKQSPWELPVDLARRSVDRGRLPSERKGGVLSVVSIANVPYESEMLMVHLDILSFEAKDEKAGHSAPEDCETGCTPVRFASAPISTTLLASQVALLTCSITQLAALDS